MVDGPWVVDGKYPIVHGLSHDIPFSWISHTVDIPWWISHFIGYPMPTDGMDTPWVNIRICNLGDGEVQGNDTTTWGGERRRQLREAYTPLRTPRSQQQS